MHVADAVSARSLCVKASVGAVIVTSDNRVNSISYNGPAAGLKREGPCSTWCRRAMSRDMSSSYDTCDSIHAEANCIARADWTQIRGGTIYVTASPCMSCAKIISNSGLERAVILVGDEDAHRDPDTVISYLESCGMAVTRVSR